MLQAKIALRSTTVYVINVHGNHWAFVTATQKFMKHWDLWWLDSYHWKYENPGELYVDVFERMYKKLLKDARPEYHKYSLTRNGDALPERPVITTNARKTLEVPKQADDFNCGVFMCANVYCVLHGLDPSTFTAADMDYKFRKHMMLSVLKQKLQPLISYPDPKKLVQMPPAPFAVQNDS